MAVLYEVRCDKCGKITKTKDGKTSLSDAEVGRNNWSLSLSNHWLEDSENKLLELKHDSKLDFDLCLDCAKEVAGVFQSLIKNAVDNTK